MGLVTSGLISIGTPVSQILASLVNQTISALQYISTAGAGVDAFKVTTNGSRWHIGTGALDYFTSDGTNITCATDFYSAKRFVARSGNAGFTFGSSGNQFFGMAAGSNLVTFDAGGGLGFNSKLAFSSTAPTISSGFGTGPSISGTSTAAFTITVGTGGVASTGVISFPAATTGWAVTVRNLTTHTATQFITKQTATTTTTATIGNYNTAGAAAAWVAGDVLLITAVAY